MSPNVDPQFSVSKQADRQDESLEFLALFFGDKPWPLIAIHRDSHDIKAATFGQAARRDEADEWIRRWNGQNYNVYFAVNPLKRAAAKKAGKDDVAAATHLWVDLDPGKDANLASERNAITHLLNGGLPDRVPPPTWVIDSGRGFWALWQLSTPHAVDGRDGPLTAVVEAYGRGIELAFGNRADVCRNIERIARLPGTINHKTGQRAFVVSHQPDRVYDIAAFPRADVERDPDRDFDVRHVVVDDLPISNRIKDIIHQGRDADPVRYKSRSEAVRAVLVAMAGAGCDNDQMATVMLDESLPIGQHIRERRDARRYLARQIASARQYADADRAEQHDDSNNAVEAPRPLIREIPPADPFPVDALGGVLEAAARAIHDRVRAPMAICAQSVLATATLAAQAHADLVLPTGHQRPVSCNFITIAESGERKTSADEEAMRPVRNYEARLRGQHDTDRFSFENDKAAWETARDTVVKAGKGDRYAIKQNLDLLGHAPTPPLSPILTCDEPTIEGLVKLYLVGRPSLGLFANEGGKFIGGHALNDDNKLRTATGLSELWDGVPIRRVRAGDGAMVLPGRRLAMHLLVQPDVAAIMLTDPMLHSQGLLSRLLIAAPNTTAGTRFQQDERPESQKALDRYNARMLAILDTPPLLAPDKVNELAPRSIRLSGGATEGWKQYADHVERAIGPGGELEPIRALANKLPEHAARLAAVLALTTNLDVAEISAADLEAGIRLADYYAAEMLRLLDLAAVSQNLRLAEKLRVWLIQTWPDRAVSIVDIYQRGPGAIRENATAKKMVGILEAHGWLIRIPGGATTAGQRRRDAWEIVGK